MNRALRRQFARETAKNARRIAKSCLDYDRGAVSGPLAIAALTRAIRRYAVLGITSDPTVLELSPSEMEDFPTASGPLDGARHWLAVGLAIDGTIAWTTASIAFTGITDAVQQKLNAINIMSAKLQPELERYGVRNP